MRLFKVAFLIFLLPQSIFLGIQASLIFDIAIKSSSNIESIILILLGCWIFLLLLAVFGFAIWYLKIAYQSRPLLLPEHPLRSVLMLLSFPFGFALCGAVEFKESP
jgi:hypothetical protein